MRKEGDRRRNLFGLACSGVPRLVQGIASLIGAKLASALRYDSCVSLEFILPGKGEGSVNPSACNEGVSLNLAMFTVGVAGKGVCGGKANDFYGSSEVMKLPFKRVN